MKKLLLVPLLCLSLGGCLTFQQVETAVTLGNASIANPVTATRLQQIESATILVFTGLKAWRTSCVNGLLPDTCKQQIRNVQVYTKQIPGYLTQLRGFVRNNDQVNAGVIYNVLTDLISQAKTNAASANQTIGG